VSEKTKIYEYLERLSKGFKIRISFSSYFVTENEEKEFVIDFKDCDIYQIRYIHNKGYVTTQKSKLDGNSLCDIKKDLKFILTNNGYDGLLKNYNEIVAEERKEKIKKILE